MNIALFLYNGYILSYVLFLCFYIFSFLPSLVLSSLFSPRRMRPAPADARARDKTQKESVMIARVI